MQDFQLVTGMVIHQDPVGDYDRRIVLLTKDSGKISAFAKGARRPNSKYVSTTDLFCFGDFKLYAGRDSFTVTDVSIKNYFSEIRADLDASLYGMYFLEVVEYNTRQFNDEFNILRLLYSSVKALGREDIPNSLVKLIFEFKLYFLQGEFAIKEEWRRRYKPSTIYTLEFIEGISIVPSWTNNSLYSSYESSIEKCDKGIKDIIDSYKLMEELHES